MVSNLAKQLIFDDITPNNRGVYKCRVAVNIPEAFIENQFDEAAVIANTLCEFKLLYVIVTAMHVRPSLAVTILHAVQMLLQLVVNLQLVATEEMDSEGLNYFLPQSQVQFKVYIVLRAHLQTTFSSPGRSPQYLAMKLLVIELK